MTPLPAPHTVRDRIAFRSSLRPLVNPAFRVISALQDFEADVQLEALALTLVTMCRPLGVDVHDLINRAKRQLESTDHVKSPELEAIAAYAAGELK